MPQEPKRKHSKARQGKRRASIKLVLPTLTVCTNCHSKTYPHAICVNCGFYNGRQVMLKQDVKHKNETEK